mmetsp:Transcript_2396/g.3244  ORF Transcript_2396/g.3244 Transcript_2396/m.3244 type:complete len:116 (-) Transcript_2396:152-499(-)
MGTRIQKRNYCHPHRRPSTPSQPNTAMANYRHFTKVGTWLAQNKPFSQEKAPVGMQSSERLEEESLLCGCEDALVADVLFKKESPLPIIITRHQLCAPITINRHLHCAHTLQSDS